MTMAANMNRDRVKSHEMTGNSRPRWYRMMARA